MFPKSSQNSEPQRGGMTKGIDYKGNFENFQIFKLGKNSKIQKNDSMRIFAIF